jgi:hypothetical protein
MKILILLSVGFWCISINAQSGTTPKDTFIIDKVNDTFIKPASLTDSSGVEDKIYVNVTEKASFKNGNDKLSKFISDNIIYPKKSQKGWHRRRNHDFLCYP